MVVEKTDIHAMENQWHIKSRVTPSLSFDMFRHPSWKHSSWFRVTAVPEEVGGQSRYGWCFLGTRCSSAVLLSVPTIQMGYMTRVLQNSRNIVCDTRLAKGQRRFLCHKSHVTVSAAEDPVDKDDGSTNTPANPNPKPVSRGRQVLSDYINTFSAA
jgi:hypothetical protein